MNGATFKLMSLKRYFDIILSAFAIVILSPVFCALWLMVRNQFGKPSIFQQTRPGRNGVPFEMFKFRSMTDARDASGALQPDSLRITPFGSFLRSTSLDELPELWNVLKGEMSLVGPRPLLMEYLPLYSAREFRRHEMKPGITGWAQVKGRNAISWSEKFALDVWYVDNQTLLVDLKIMVITVWKLIVREGISHGGDATMPRFQGHEAK
jgi:sugar transferase EpsL